MSKELNVITKFGLNIPNEMIKYAPIRSDYLNYAIKRSEEFNLKFNEMFTDMDDLAKNGFITGYEFIEPKIKTTFELLVSMGVYDLSIEVFLKQYFLPYFEWESAFSSIIDKYADICMDQEQAEQYREQRKNSRSKWGVITSGNYADALEARINAGIWNFAEGIGHSIFNAIGNTFSRMEANSKKNKLFNDPKTKELLTDGIFKTCFNLHYAFIDVVNSIFKQKLPSKKNLIAFENSVTNMLNNLQNNRIPSSEIPVVVKEMFNLFPFKIELYEYLLKTKFYNKNEIVQICSALKIDIFFIFFGRSFYNLKNFLKDSTFEERVNVFNFIDDIEEVNKDIDDKIKIIKKLCLTYQSLITDLDYEFENFTEWKAVHDFENNFEKNVEYLISHSKYYSFSRRTKIFSKIDNLNVQNDRYNELLKSMKKECLHYNHEYYDDLSTLEKQMEKDESFVKNIIQSFSYTSEATEKIMQQFKIPYYDNILYRYLELDDKGKLKEGYTSICFTRLGIYFSVEKKINFLSYYDLQKIKNLKIDLNKFTIETLDNQIICVNASREIGIYLVKLSNLDVEDNLDKFEELGCMLSVLVFLLPPVGILMSIIWGDKRPYKSSYVKAMGCLSVIFAIILIIIFFSR